MNRIIVKEKYSEEILKDHYIYSFINPYSLFKLDKIVDTEIVYFVDGSLLACILNIIFNKKINRVSFDDTSIAPVVFDYCAKNNLRIGVVGGTEEENVKFCGIQKGKNKYLNIELAMSGYCSIEHIVEEVERSNVNLIVLGLGTPLQEVVASLILKKKPSVKIFTCGGYITQTAKSEKTYYPSYIDKFNLRAFYRFYNEKHTRKRYLIDYPLNVIKLVTNVILKKLVVTII